MERLIDMEDRHLCLLRKLLSDHLANKTVWAYGSRAKWNAKQSSDLDLVVWDASTTQITEAIDAFSESNLPFTVQLFAWENTPKDFQEDIRKKYVVLQEGSKIPEGWREVKLGDVAKIQIGRTPPRKQFWWFSKNRTDKKWISIKDMKDANLYLRNVSEYLTEEAIEKFNIPAIAKGTVILSFKLTVGRVAITSEDMYSNEAIAQFQIKENADLLNYFLHYYLKDFNYNKLQSTSSIANAINTEIIKSIPIRIPPLPEQKAIAEVLSSLDDKIDLLHRQNKTLQDIAQTLFQKWFIEDAGEEWEEKPLDEIANYLNGLACQKYPPENEFDRLPVLKIRELTGGISDNSDWASTKVDNKYIIELGDIIFSWSGSLVLKIWDGRKCILNQHLFKVTSGKYPKWFFYLWTKYYLEKFVSIAKSKATTMGHIKRGDIANSIVLIPSDSKMEKISETMEVTFGKIVANLKKIRTLETMRNAFLPKLINGEMRLS